MITGGELWELLSHADEHNLLTPHGLTWNELNGPWQRLCGAAARVLNERALAEKPDTKDADPCATMNCGHSLSREHKSLPGGRYGLCYVAACRCEKGQTN